jgi:predicted Fe-Mo cluster-binding NifX family protein
VPTKIAIPRFGEAVAPCFEYSATISIFTVRARQVIDQLDFRLKSQDPLDRVRLLRDQDVKTLICGGVQERFEYLVVASGIRVISWVSGSVDELLRMFLNGQLTPGNVATARPRASRFEQA